MVTFNINMLQSPSTRISDFEFNQRFISELSYMWIEHKIKKKEIHFKEQQQQNNNITKTSTMNIRIREPMCMICEWTQLETTKKLHPPPNFISGIVIKIHPPLKKILSCVHYTKDIMLHIYSMFFYMFFLFHTKHREFVVSSFTGRQQTSTSKRLEFLCCYFSFISRDSKRD